MASHTLNGIYVSNLDSQASLGYESKIAGQVRGLAQPNITCKLITYSEDGKVVLRNINSEGELEISGKTLKSAASSLVVRRYCLLEAAFDQLKKGVFDFLYLRYPRSDPLYIYYLWKFKRHFPELIILCEYPTFPYDKEKVKHGSLKSFLVQFLDRTSRKFLKYFIYKAVSINYAGYIFDMPSISISNGVTVDNFPLRKPQAEDDKSTINLLGVANVQPWHGFDRIVRGLGNYYQQNRSAIEINLHIVGILEPMRSRLLEIAFEHKIEDRLTLSPPSHGELLDSFFDAADIAVSTLGAHRINLHELSPLKTREYCARGIPFLLGYFDPDFGPDFEYALKVSANDDPIDISQVINFALSHRRNRCHPQNMRQYAESNLDWSIKMQPVAQAISAVSAL